MVCGLDIENTGGCDTLTFVVLEIDYLYTADLHTGGILPEKDSRFSYLWYS